MPQQTPTDDIRSILDPAQADKSVKATAWDAFHKVKTPQEFQAAFDKVDLPKETKAALWDKKFGGKQTEESEHARQLKGGDPSSTRLEDALPPLGAGIGAALAAPGFVTAVGGAALGASTGEAGKQLIKRFVRGKDYPATSADAAKDIGIQGAVGGATEAVSQGLAKPLTALSKGFGKVATAGSRLPLKPSEAGVGGAAAQTIERFTEHAIPSKGVMDAFREKQIAAAEKIASEEIAKISKFRGTPEEMGQATQKGLADARTRMKNEASAAYKEIDALTQSHTQRVPVMREQTSSLVDEFGKPMTFEKRTLEKQQVGGVTPKTLELRKTAVSLIKEIRDQEKLMDPTLLEEPKRVLSSIIQSPREVSFQAMAKSRSDLLALGRRLDDILPGKRAGIARKLAGLMDESMIEAAENSGVPNLAQKVRDANKLTFDMHAKFDQQLTKKIMESGRPEDVAAYIKQGGLQEIRDMNSLLTEPQRRLVQSQIMKGAVKDATENGTKAFEPARFAKSIYDLGPERGKELFGANYKNVKEVADLLGKVKMQSSGGMGSMMHNYAYIVGAMSMLPTLIFRGPETAAIAAGGLAAEGMAMRKVASALTNPAKSARVAHYFAMMARGAPYAVYGLASLVKGEPDDTQSLPPLTPDSRVHQETHKQLTGLMQ